MWESSSSPGSRSAVQSLNVLLRISAFAGVLVLAPILLHAQLDTATLTGTITDSSGAVIEGAQISITNEETRAVRNSTTTGSGDYSVSALQPGKYDVTISKEGFRPETLTAETLSVGQVLQVSVTLQVGATSQALNVTADAQTVETSNATLGTVIQQQQIVDLPLNGRQFTQLLQLAPGTVPIDISQNNGKEPNFGAGAPTPSVNGQTNRSDLFYIDGIFATNPFFSGFSLSPSIDAIQEFKEQTHTDQAEFGGSTGAIISVVSRSGTNQLHGSLFEFFRNGDLDARNTFSPTKLPYHQNQFGGTFSGPIMRNKLFFFANYEGGRQVQPLPGIYTVPTLAERQGDFSQVPGYAVAPAIYDPATYNPVTQTETAFPGNKIPSNRINAGMLAYLNGIYPLPNTTPGPNGTNNFISDTGNRGTGDQGTIRIDYDLGNKDIFNGRYSQGEDYNTTPANLNDTFTTGFNGKNTGINWIHTYSPTMVSQITAAYNTLNIPQSVGLLADQATLFSDAGLGAGFNKYPGDTTAVLVPGMNLNGGSYSGFWNGAGPIGPMTTGQISGSVDKVLGNHDVKLGGSYYKTWMYTNWAGNNLDYSNKATWNAACQFASTNAAAAGECPGGSLAAAGGDPVASLLLSLPIDATRYLGNSGVSLRLNTASGFAQDSWKLTPKLTVNYGLRWDFTSAVTDKDNRLTTYDIYTHQYLVSNGDTDLPSGPLPANVALSGDNYVAPARNYLAPRLGLAYQITDKTVLRAGFGRAVDSWTLALQVAQNARGAWPSGLAQIASTQSLNIAGVSTKPDGTPVTGQNPFYGPAVLPPSPLPAGGLGFQDTRWQPDSSVQWNVELQQEIRSLGTLSVGYVASDTSHLTMAIPYDLAAPSTNAIKVFPDQVFGGPGTVIQSIGTSNYESMQVKLTRNFSNGFTHTAAFTWARSLGTGLCGDSFTTCVQNPANIHADYGPTALDVPFIFTYSAVYQLPFGKGRQYLTSGPAALLLGNWQINGIFAARSGLPINITTNDGDIANTGGGTQRAEVVGNSNSAAPHTTAAWFNTAAFAYPTAGTFGDAGLDSVRGPGFWDADFSLFREFPVTERAKLQFRGEFFDILNHPNYASPNAVFGSGGFGSITSTVDGPGANRDIQFGLKLLF